MEWRWALFVVEYGNQVCGVEMGSVRCRVWNSGVWSGNGLCSLWSMEIRCVEWKWALSVIEYGNQVCGVEMGSVRYRVWDSGVWSGNKHSDTACNLRIKSRHGQ